MFQMQSFKLILDNESKQANPELRGLAHESSMKMALEFGNCVEMEHEKKNKTFGMHKHTLWVVQGDIVISDFISEEH